MKGFLDSDGPQKICNDGCLDNTRVLVLRGLDPTEVLQRSTLGVHNILVAF